MGSFADRMAELDVHLSSPDGNIHSRLSGSDEVRFWFETGSYERYTEIALQGQLESLGRLLLAARARARREAFREALGGQSDAPSEPSDDPRRRRFQEEQARLIAVGRTASMEITATPGESWSLRIQPGTLVRLTEDQFLAAFQETISLAVSDIRRRLWTLRRQVFGQEVPTSAIRGGQPWR